MLRLRDYSTLTIASGATTSDAFDASRYALFAVLFPAAFTGVTISFSVSGDGTNYQPLRDVTGTLSTVPVNVNTWTELPAALATFLSFKIVSSGAEGASRSLVVAAKS